jgi:hypothetical protein
MIAKRIEGRPAQKATPIVGRMTVLLCITSGAEMTPQSMI